MSIAAMQMCQERGWTGFEWEWMESKSAKPRQTEADRDRLNTGLDENIKIKVLN